MNKSMTLISAEEFRSMMLRKTNSSIVSIVYVPKADMRAADKNNNPNPFRIGKGKSATFTVVKVNKSNGNIASRYENVVGNRLIKEIREEREAQGLEPLDAIALEREVNNRFRQGESWHRPIMAEDGPTCLSVNKKDINESGETYLRIILKSSGGGEWLNLDGSTRPTDEVTPFVNPPSTYSNQGLSDENTVKFQCPSLDSIIEISIDGERYRISDNFETQPIQLRKRLWEIADEYLAGERTMSKV